MRSRLGVAGVVAFGLSATWMLWRGVVGAPESEDGLVGLATGLGASFTVVEQYV